ncbi:MAG: hypothetical protein U0694_22935 [Anaerolineae bacterium]
MKFAIQEDMLPGRTLRARLKNARELGFAGVEFWSDGLTERVPQVAEALAEHGLSASAVNMGTVDGFCIPMSKPAMPPSATCARPSLMRWTSARQA